MSQSGHRAIVSRAALAVASLAVIAAVPARAQDDAEPEVVIADLRIEERQIVVSAKNPGEDPLELAAPIAVIPENQLHEREVQDLTGLSYAAPNVSLDAIGTFKGVANFAIRGLGINSSIPSIDPAVGLFVDGIYQGINAGTLFDLLDVRRVTILYGPQGVAFGRNTTGGAVLVETNDPTWDWQGQARMGFDGPVDGGRGAGMATVRAVASGPLSDRVAIRLAGLHSSDRGWFENSFDGSPFGRAKTTVLRGGLSLRASERLELTVKAEWTGSHGDGATTKNIGQHARDDFSLSVNEEGFYRSDGASATFKAELELGEGMLTNLFGWREYDLATRNDIDSSPVTIFHSDTRTAQEQWSNELYYTADYGPLAVTAGAYLFHQTIGYDEARDLATDAFGGGRQGHDVYGLFGEIAWQPADPVTLTGGLRWSREEKDAAVTFVRPRAPCSSIDRTCPVSGQNLPGENNGFTDGRAWENFLPRVSLAYRPMEQATLYASWSRGFRSGGYNLRITQPAAFEQIATVLGTPAFDEEQVDNFELGAKWELSSTDWISAALFRTDVKGMQRELNVPSLSSGLAQSVYNTADARIEGLELQAMIEPVEGLSLSGNLGLIDADYRRVFFDLNSDNLIDAADLALALPRAPEWTAGGSASWTEELGGLGTLVANAFFQHRAAYAYTDNNWGFNSPSDRLDASLALRFDDPAITVTVYGRNLLDEVQFGGDTQLPFAGGPFSDGNNRPFDPHPAAGTFSPVNKGRVLGIELAVDF